MAELFLGHGLRHVLRGPHVMAILNATPDSFSDGGRLPEGADLERHVQNLLEEGADILDVGGESTRPGHEPVSVADELARILPVIRTLRRVDAGVPVSIDTTKAAVAKAALAAGASFVNDVSALGDPEMGKVVRDAGCSVVLMRREPCRGAVVVAARAELERHVRRAHDAGLAPEQLILDPGLGFGEPPGADVVANMALVRGIAEYSHGYPVLIGASRKRFIGTMTGEPVPEKRVAGSVAVAVEAIRAGAAIVRVHDVAATVVGLKERGLR